MTTLALTTQEQEILEQTLERKVRDLELEVGHTDSHEFKEMLKQRKAVLDQLLAKLKGASVPA